MEMYDGRRPIHLRAVDLRRGRTVVEVDYDEVVDMAAKSTEMQPTRCAPRNALIIDDDPNDCIRVAVPDKPYCRSF